MVFNDLDSLWKYAKKEIKRSMKTEVVDEIKNTEQEVIQEVVLDAYQPSMYARRSEQGNNEDGLISKKNMTPHYSESDNYIQIDITNDTKGNTEYPLSTSGYIDEVVEYGKEYSWIYSEIARSKLPRPFTAVTQERVNSSDIVERTVKNNVDFEIK